MYRIVCSNISNIFNNNKLKPRIIKQINIIIKENMGRSIWRGTRRQ